MQIENRGRCIRTLALVAALLAGACGGDEPAADEGPAVLIVREPRTAVEAGGDTTVVYTPTLFVYLAADEGSATSVEQLAAFQRSLQEARGPLERMGVRVVSVTAPPRLAELPFNEPEGPAADGRFARPMGYLLVDAAGHARQVDGTLESGALVCAAARTFEMNETGC